MPNNNYSPAPTKSNGRKGSRLKKRAITNQPMELESPVTHSDLTEFSARILATRTSPMHAPRPGKTFQGDKKLDRLEATEVGESFADFPGDESS